MTVEQLREKLAKYPPNTRVVVRTVEAGEVCLTVDLTGVRSFKDAEVLLVGDLDWAAGALHS